MGWEVRISSDQLSSDQIASDQVRLKMVVDGGGGVRRSWCGFVGYPPRHTLRPPSTTTRARAHTHARRTRTYVRALDPLSSHLFAVDHEVPFLARQTRPSKGTTRDLGT